jgi:hypothetical protein
MRSPWPVRNVTGGVFRRTSQTRPVPSPNPPPATYPEGRRPRGVRLPARRERVEQPTFAASHRRTTPSRHAVATTGSAARPRPREPCAGGLAEAEPRSDAEVPQPQRSRRRRPRRGCCRRAKMWHTRPAQPGPAGSSAPAASASPTGGRSRRRRRRPGTSRRRRTSPTDRCCRWRAREPARSPTSQMRIDRSLQAVAIHRPFGLNPTAVTASECWAVKSRSPLGKGAFHTTVLSSLAVARYRPSAEKVRDCTAPRGPGNRRPSRLSGVQAISPPSARPATVVRPSGAMTTPTTGVSNRPRIASSLPVPTSHVRTVPSSLAVARVRPSGAKATVHLVAVALQRLLPLAGDGVPQSDLAVLPAVARSCRPGNSAPCTHPPRGAQDGPDSRMVIDQPRSIRHSQRAGLPDRGRQIAIEQRFGGAKSPACQRGTPG